MTTRTRISKPVQKPELSTKGPMMLNNDRNKNDETGLTGKVIKKTIGDYSVAIDGRVISCSISSKLRKTLIYPEADPASRRHVVDEVRDIDAIDPIAVGDNVVILDIGDGSGRIVEVLERNNKLSRLANLRGSGSRSVYNDVKEQVIISNVNPNRSGRCWIAFW